jgi:hypothetical protein
MNLGQSSGTGEKERHVFGCKVRLMNLGQSSGTGETGETCFWVQGPAHESGPITADRRDGRDMFLGARSGS